MSEWLIRRMFGSTAEIGFMTGLGAGLIVGNGVALLVLAAVAVVLR